MLSSQQYAPALLSCLSFPLQAFIHMLGKPSSCYFTSTILATEITWRLIGFQFGFILSKDVFINVFQLIKIG